jgi:hypothetical protein
MEVYIIDTGENYIISKKNDALDTAKQLYAIMDIMISEIPTGILIDKYTTLEFIHQSIGRVISYGFNDTDGDTRIDIPGKLVADITKVVEYSKIKAFWKNIKVKSGEEEDKKVDTIKGGKFDYNGDYMMLAEAASWKIETPPIVVNYDPIIYVLYNSIYNIALVVDNTVVPNIKELTTGFSEFVLVYEYKLPIDKSLDSEDIVEYKCLLEKVFHKVVYSNLQDIDKKISAFKLLYAGDSSGNKSEKTKVIEYMRSKYDISTDQAMRVKANDLYKEVINHMLVPYENAAAFKKRLAGYLIEMNLQKKRFSDAYYYYGLSIKEMPAVTLDQIQEQRKQDIKSYFTEYKVDALYKSKFSLEDIEEMRRKEKQTYIINATSTNQSV